MSDLRPWYCVAHAATGTFATLCRDCKCQLYLFYFSDSGGNQDWSHNHATEQWKRMAAVIESNPEGARLVPLCAATHLTLTTDKRPNWAEWKGEFPNAGTGNAAKLPYALWALSAGGLLGDDNGDSELKYNLSVRSGKDEFVSDALGGAGRPAAIRSCTDHPILAQALALKWLLENHPCATKVATQSSGLIEELCRDTTAAPAGAAAPATPSGTP